MSITVNSSNVQSRQYGGDPEVIFSKLEDFSKYAFNKSHAVAYAITAYQTAWIWTYHRDEFLEFEMNYAPKDHCNKAIDACKRLNMKITYPDITNMDSDKYQIKDNCLILPGYSDKSYTSYVDFLFDIDNKKRGELVRKGVCDKLTCDRDSLLDLISMVPNKLSQMARYMEPEGKTFNTLEQIIEGLKACGAVDSYELDRQHKEITVTIYRPRARQKYYKIHFKNRNNSVEQIVKYDLKFFNAIRPGTLSPLPFINTRSIESRLEQIKNNYEQRGYSQNRINEVLKRNLNDYMRDNNFIGEKSKRGKFCDLTVVLTDYKVYRNKAKCWIQFGDKEDFFYTVTIDDLNTIKTLDKKDVIMIDLYYSPYIKLKTSEFVYDFDIYNIRPLG